MWQPWFFIWQIYWRNHFMLCQVCTIRFSKYCIIIAFLLGIDRGHRKKYKASLLGNDKVSGLTIQKRFKSLKVILDLFFGHASIITWNIKIPRISTRPGPLPRPNPAGFGYQELTGCHHYNGPSRADDPSNKRRRLHLA